jgi:hypothetical protein
MLLAIVGFEVGEPARRERWIGFSFPAFFGLFLIVSGLRGKEFILFGHRGKGLRVPTWVVRPLLVAGGVWLLYDAITSLMRK